MLETSPDKPDPQAAASAEERAALASPAGDGQVSGRIALGRLGVCSRELRSADLGRVREAAAELEQLGFEALWVPGGARPGALTAAEAALEATEQVTVATSLLSIWIEEAAAVAAQAARLREAHPGRFVLGLGLGRTFLDADRSRQPMQAVRTSEAMRAYLDTLDRATPSLPAEARLLTALSPETLELARRRAAGAHTFLTTPSYTRAARSALGPDRLLAVQQLVAYEDDPPSARGHGRRFLSTYLGLSNFSEMLRRVEGFDDGDFADGGSDELVDALMAWGDESRIRELIADHFAAGADHVCVQIAPSPDETEMGVLRRLALPLQFYVA